MKRTKWVALAAGLLLSAAAGSGGAAVLTFDELPAAPGLIPNGYGGFNWSNMAAFDPVAYGYVESYGAGYLHGVKSGTRVAFNSAGEMATASGATFDFVGAWFTSAWSENNVLTVSAYQDGSPVGSATLTLNTVAPQWLAANLQGVDELRFTSSNFQFAMDDFTFNEQAAVPEPGTLALLGTGLAGLLGVARRRREP